MGIVGYKISIARTIFFQVYELSGLLTLGDVFVLLNVKVLDR